MKNESAICVYRDLEHQETTRADLQRTQKIMQTLLDSWNTLNIGPCTDINSLLMQTEKVYQRAIDRLVEVPDNGGKFQVKKSAYMDTLQLPDPSSLFGMAKKVRQEQYAAVPSLWTIKDNQVTLIAEEATIFIDAKSIYAESPAAVRFAQKMTTLCELINEINQITNGELLPFYGWSYQWAQNKLKLKQHTNNGLLEASPDIDFLKRWLPKVK
jgi:hypothetical protein